MITEVFPNKILIKDYNLSDEWNEKVVAITSFIYQQEHYSNSVLDDPIPLFSDENIAACPELKELREMFIDSFYELASSYSNNILKREHISTMVNINITKLPFMKKGDYKSVHTHENVDAFAIFYLSDVNNNTDGGKLILHDPTFKPFHTFQEDIMYPVETKKHRMIVCPNRIWHEVTPYNGDETRMLVVVNIDSGRPWPFYVDEDN